MTDSITAQVERLLPCLQPFCTAEIREAPDDHRLDCAAIYRPAVEQALREAGEKKLEAIDRLHQPHRMEGVEWCLACAGSTWPCATHRILTQPPTTETTKCPCPIYCRFCGAKRRRDTVGHYCPTKNCQWQHGYEGCTLYRKEKSNGTE